MTFERHKSAPMTRKGGIRRPLASMRQVMQIRTVLAYCECGHGATVAVEWTRTICLCPVCAREEGLDATEALRDVRQDNSERRTVLGWLSPANPPRILLLVFRP
jgi:hypothetical protein